MPQSTNEERQRLEILHIYEPDDTTKLWKSGIVETIYNDPNTISCHRNHNDDKITIYFKPISEINSLGFHFTASHYYIDKEEIISLTGGCINIKEVDFQGKRIGTWIMNEIVKWAKKWPNANIEKIQLLDNDAYDENKERRNKFYENFGIKFTFETSEKKKGISNPIKASELNIVDSWDKNKKGNISTQKINDFIIALHKERDKLLAENKRLEKKLNMQKKPVKSRLKQFFKRGS